MYSPLTIALLVVSCLFPLLASLSVGLRLYTRYLAKQSLDLSDYFIFITLTCAIGNGINCIVGATYAGVGLPLSQLSGDLVVRFMKVEFASQFFYIFALWSVKVSVVLFYKSIFSSSKRMMRTANVMLVVLSAWIVAFFFVTVFQDNPIARNWGAPGTTVNWRALYITEAATDVFLDLVILCIPLAEMKGLRMERRRKWTIIGIFWLGAIIVVASILRLAYMIRVKIEYENEDIDFSDANVMTIIWGVVEPSTSVIAACLPIITTIVVNRKRAANRTRYITSSMGSSSKPRNLIRPSQRETSDLDTFDSVVLVERNASSGSASSDNSLCKDDINIHEVTTKEHQDVALPSEIHIERSFYVNYNS